MSEVSISEAARQAGISRSYLYRKYITPGVISTGKDAVGNPVIDTSEIIRVFGSLQGDGEQAVKTIQLNAPEKDSKIAALEAELRLMRELAKAKDDHIADLQQALRQLEHKPPTGDSAVQIEKLQGQLNLLKKEQSWFMRIFGSKEPPT